MEYLEVWLRRCLDEFDIQCVDVKFLSYRMGFFVIL